MVNIREINPSSDAKHIAAIYRWYVENTTATFELEPLSDNAMLQRIEEIAIRFPYFVYEEDGKITGYCYAHTWKDFPAYDITLETTIYLRPDTTGHGHGKALMEKLIAECRNRGVVSLIACITTENEGSCHFHESLGFIARSCFHSVGKKFGRLLGITDYQLLLNPLN